MTKFFYDVSILNENANILLQKSFSDIVNAEKHAMRLINLISECELFQTVTVVIDKHDAITGEYIKNEYTHTFEGV